MDEMLYQDLVCYYRTLEATGYVPDKDVWKLLVMSFYKDFVENDYRGLINEEDYHLIEKALNCLYGTSYLIPYPDYLKMGKLQLGQMSELAQRVQALEETDVVKLMHQVEPGYSSDVILTVEGEEN